MNVTVWHYVFETDQFSRCEIGMSGNMSELMNLHPGGVYTTIRTYPGKKILRLKAHIDRLRLSARLIGVDLTVDTNRLREIMRIAIYENDKKSSCRFRIHAPLAGRAVNDLFLYVEAFPATPPNRNCVSTLTRSMHRDNPRAKTTDFITTADSLRAGMPSGVEEILMLDDDGGILEGLSSNFFGIRDGVVWTANQGVLAGITRAFVLEAIQLLGLALNYSAYPANSMDQLDEAFITSTSRGILPIQQIDQVDLSHRHPCPGTITMKIKRTFDALIEMELEPL